MPYCAISGCESGHTRKKDLGIFQSFYLPTSKDIKERWLEKIRIKRPDFAESIHSRVCAKHFRLRDYMANNENVTSRGKLKKKRKLKPTAIPSLYLNGTSCEVENDMEYSIDSEIKMDLTEEIIPSENPWSVPNVSEFLKYCCPECEYSDQNLDDFSEHAIENHLMSVTLFDIPKNHKKSKILSEETATNGTITDIKIEPVIDMYDNNEDDIKSENKDEIPYEEDNDIIDNEDENIEDESYVETKLEEEEIETETKIPKKSVKSKNSKQIQANQESLKSLESDLISAQTSGNFNCSLCETKISFEHKFQLVTHWYENHSDVNVTYEVCQWCMELFISSGNLTKHHEKLHFGLSRHEYQCSSCRYNFHDMQSLKGHVKRKHEKDAELPFKCNICDTAFILGEALLYHQLTEHGHKIETQKCEECRLEFFSKGTKAIHDTICHEAPSDQLHACKFCLEVTNSISEIIKHHQEYHEVQALPYFQCEHCDYVSEKNAETRDHMKSEHDIDDYKPYKCKHCEYTHNHIRYLAEHVKNHNPNRSFICDICGASLKSASSLKYHKTSYHKKGMQELVCDICGFATVHLNNLKRHIKAMHGKREKCPYCENNYGTKDALCHHLDVSHPDTSELKFFCASCGKGFMYKYSLAVHTAKSECSKVPKSKVGIPVKVNGKKADDSSDAPMLCDICRSEYTVKTITNHYRRSHPDKYFPEGKRKEYKCNHCEEKFFSTQGLTFHRYNIHGINDCANVCNVCNKPYKNFHKCQDRKKRETVKCRHCDKIFKNVSNLRFHIKGFHNEDKTDVCKFCGKSFAGKPLLKTHIRQSHSRKTCPHCQKSLLNRFFLKKHLVFDHGITEGALFCNICPKKVFFMEGMLKNHMQEKHDQTS